MSIRIAITDDHPLIISGLQTLLKGYEDIVVTACYQNGKELLEGLKKVQPDILLLDIQMPGQQGDALAAIVSRLYPAVSIIVLTNLDSPYYINSILQHPGVMGYVLKTSGQETLVKAITSVSKGQQYYEQVIKERKVAVSKQQTGMQLMLTRREKEVLQLIASDYSSQDIANQLFISKRTVDNHRISLLLKLEVKNSASLIKKAIGLGLIK